MTLNRLANRIVVHYLQRVHSWKQKNWTAFRVQLAAASVLYCYQGGLKIEVGDVNKTKRVCKGHVNMVGGRHRKDRCGDGRSMGRLAIFSLEREGGRPHQSEDRWAWVLAPQVG